MRVVLLAPGESLSPELANFFVPGLRADLVGVINNAYELAPWADFLVANDLKWWKLHPEAKRFRGRKFSTNRIDGVEKVKAPTVNTATNSGTLGLEVARQFLAKELLLFGFDMHGTHFFGAYTNGCKQTTNDRRELHQVQYQRWADANPSIVVRNMTPGSHLRAFPPVVP